MTPALLLVLWAAAAPDAASAPRVHQSSTGGVIVNPLGVWLRHDIAVDSGLLPGLLGGEGFWGDVRVGGFTQGLVYSTELGARVSWLTKPELLILSSEVAVDGGRFIEAGTDVSGGTGLDVRVPHVRLRLTSQALLNLKLSQWWFYSRSTAALRLRDFVELDPFLNLTVQNQLDLEQATALMKRVCALRPLWGAATSASPSQLWLYAEYTVGLVVDLEAARPLLRPNRVSSGLIAENFPARGTLLNLDVFWSFTDAPRVGPGVIALYGFVF